MMFLILGILLLSIDQYSKYLVRTKMEVFETYPIIEDFFHLTYVQNKGAAFGMFQGATVIFAVVTLIVIVGMIYFSLKHKNMSLVWKVTLTVIASGAVGNLIDRLWLGYVVDMFDFRGIWSFIFNFADVCVVVGGCVMMLLVLRDEKVLEKR